MPVCDVCGNDYAQVFQVIAANGKKFTFDSLECAAHKIAPTCAHCQCRVLGHGIEAGQKIYCCANCARHAQAHGTHSAKKETDTVAASS